MEQYPAKYSFDGTRWNRTGDFRFNSLLISQYRAPFVDQEARAFRSEDQVVIVRVGSLYPGLDTWIEVQANLAGVKRLMEKTGWFWFWGNHRERLTHSLHELPRSEVVNKGSENGDGALEAKGDRAHPGKAVQNNKGCRAEKRTSA